MHNLTNKHIAESVECCVKADCKSCPLSHYKDFTNDCEKHIIGVLRDENVRLKAEVERLHTLCKPTEASGFRTEKGKVVFYTNILNGYRHEYNDLDEVVKELNLMLQNAYKNDSIIGFYKNTIEEQVSKLKTAKSEAIREFAERLKKKIFPFPFAKISEINNLVKEMTEGK